MLSLNAVLFGLNLQIQHLQVLNQLSAAGFRKGSVSGRSIDWRPFLTHVLDETQVVVEQLGIQTFRHFNTRRQVGQVGSQLDG